MIYNNLDDACRLACEQIGVNYKAVAADGQWHGADLADDHRGKGDARIKLFPDRQGGIVWNHKSGEKQTFFLNRIQPGETLTAAERDRIERERQHRQAERLRKYNQAARRALAIWNAALPAPANHPYLVRKQVKPHGLRLGTWKTSVENEAGTRVKLEINNALLVPMFDENGAIRSLQAIFPAKCPELDRDKDFLPGASSAGLFWWIGAKTTKVLIGEGFATCATLHEETGYRAYIAFTANNLLPVGQIIRAKLPDANIVFCADNDTKTAGNPGLTKATEAAQAVGGSVAVPPIPGDFNDYAMFLKEAANG